MELSLVICGHVIYDLYSLERPLLSDCLNVLMKVSMSINTKHNHRTQAMSQALKYHIIEGL